MRKKISKSILQFLTICSLFLLPLSGWSQEKSVQANDKEEHTKNSFYQGTAIGLEIAGIGSYLLGSDIMNSEIQVQSNLLNKYFPVVEVGFGKTDATDDATDNHYKTSAPYFRIGIDYNFLHKKTHLPGVFLVGLRYGFSSFSYDVDAPNMKDPIYGGNTEIPFAFKDQKAKSQWIEAGIALKAKIYKGFHMGWSVRYKRRISVTKQTNSEAWYIPGFGKNADSSFNLSYHLIYNLPF